LEIGVAIIWQARYTAVKDSAVSAVTTVAERVGIVGCTARFSVLPVMRVHSEAMSLAY